LTDPGAWAAPTTPQAPIDPNWGQGVTTPLPPIGYPSPGGTPPVGGGPGQTDIPGRGPITIRHDAPDYSGILSAFDTDWQGKLQGSLGAREAQRQMQARATINRLGIRDPTAMFNTLQQYGLTMQNLQDAADNPFSDLRAIQQQADRARSQGLAQYGARGTFRSGGAAQTVENVDNQRRLAEATANETALGSLNQGQFDVKQYEADQRTQHEADLGNMRGQLAQAYQPYDTTAEWDASAGGYRSGNTIYDQYGNVIG
jgi:hypothetical protein